MAGECRIIEKIKRGDDNEPTYSPVHTNRTGLAGALPAAATRNQYIELSFYFLSGGAAQSSRLTEFLENQHLPMTKRLGIGPVGYFGLREAPESARAMAQKRGEALPEPGSRFVSSDDLRLLVGRRGEAGGAASG